MADKKSLDENNVNRMSKTEYYLAIALVVSKRSTCLKRRYGAVIVNNDEIISTGYNGNPRGDENCCDRGNCKRMDLPSNSGNYNDCFSVHAEQNAMISASRNEMLGSTIYLAGEKYDDGRRRDKASCAYGEQGRVSAGARRKQRGEKPAVTTTFTDNDSRSC